MGCGYGGLYFFVFLDPWSVRLSSIRSWGFVGLVWSGLERLCYPETSHTSGTQGNIASLACLLLALRLLVMRTGILHVSRYMCVLGGGYGCLSKVSFELWREYIIFELAFLLSSWWPFGGLLRGY